MTQLDDTKKRVRIDAGVHRQAKLIAVQRKVGLSEFLSQAIAAGIKAIEEKDAPTKN